MESNIITDQTNTPVSIPTEPLRIISLVPSQTELLHYLGLEKEVVGITKFCIHPEAWFRNKTRIGGTKQYHFDRIATLNPNLIIGNKEENDKAQVEELKKSYPVWISDIKNLADATAMIDIIGSIVKKEPEAKILIQQINQAFQKLVSFTPATSPLRVLYLIWQKPYMTIGGDTFINDMIEKAGFVNIMANKTRYPILTEDELRHLQPDLIFLSSEPFPFKQKHIAALTNICPAAVIKLVDGEYFSWYGSRLLHTAEYLRNLVVELNE